MRAVTIIMFLAVTMFSAHGQCGSSTKCSPNLEKYSLLKTYPIDLPQRESKMDAPKQLDWPVILSKGIRYRITGCPNRAHSSTDMVMGLHLGSKLISTNKSKDGKTYKAFEFVCNKTGVYYLKAYFVNGVKGCGAASLSMSK